MDQSVAIFINPWTYCDKKCPFCFYSKEELDDYTLLDLGKLKEDLDYLSSKYNTIKATLYGGELSCMAKERLDKYLNLVSQYNLDEFAIVTNLSVSPFTKKEYNGKTLTVGGSWYSWNSKFFERVVEYKNYYKRFSVTLMPYNDEYYKLLKVDKVIDYLEEMRVGYSFVNTIIDTNSNSLKMLLNPDKYNKFNFINSYLKDNDCNVDTFVISSKGYSLGVALINKKYDTLQEVIKVREEARKTDCKNCHLVGVCNTLPDKCTIEVLGLQKETVFKARKNVVKQL